MRLEKGEISSSQLMFLVAGFVQGSVQLLGFVTKVSRQDTWLVVLSGLGIGLFLVLIYIALAQKFPGKNLMQIDDIVYGPYLGKFVSALYVWFFFSLVFLNLRVLGDFLLTYVMPETPMVAILIMFTFVCAWTVRRGLEVITRLSFVFVVITVLEVLLTFVLLLKDMRLTNFLPIFELSFKEFIQGTHTMAILPFGEVLVFLMVIPYMNKIKQAKTTFLMGLIIAGATMLTVTVQNTAVLGIASTIMGFPSYEAVRLIDIAKFITRLELFVAIVLLVTIFLKISVLYYATVLGIAQMFHLRSYLPLVLPIGIASISFAVLSFDSNMESANWGITMAATYSSLFEFLIPAISLLIAQIRRLPKKKGA